MALLARLAHGNVTARPGRAFAVWHAVGWAVVLILDVAVQRAVHGAIPNGVVVIGVLIAPLHALQLVPPRFGWPGVPRWTRPAAVAGLVAVGADVLLTATRHVVGAHHAQTVAIGIAAAVCLGLSGRWPWHSAEAASAPRTSHARGALELVVLALAAAMVVWSFEAHARGGLARLLLLLFVAWESLTPGRPWHRHATISRVATAACIGALSLASGRDLIQIVSSLYAAAVAVRALQERLRRPELGWLVLVVVAAQIPYLLRDFLVLHDTMLMFQLFYAFLSEYVGHGELARWLPYGGFGIRALYLQLTSLTASDYLVGVAAALLGFRDAYSAFLLSVVLGYLIFLVGAYLLASYLFVDRRTVFLVCAILASTTAWEASLNWTFRPIEFLPLGIYLLLRFFASASLTHLATLALVAVAAAIGVGYSAIAVVFGLVPMVVLLARGGLRRAVDASRAWIWAPAFAMFLVVAAAWLVCQVEGLVGLQPLASGRNPSTGRVPLETFLTYGGTVTWSALLESVFLGWPLVLPVGWHYPWYPAQPVWGDQAVYVGLLPIAMIVVALVWARSRYLFALLSPAGALVWLSFGGMFAIVAYVLPGMGYYRHLAHTYAIVKVFLVLSAGFGLDYLWRHETAILASVARVGASLTSRPWRWLLVAAGLAFLLDTSYAPTLRATGAFGLAPGIERAAGVLVRAVGLLLLLAHAARAGRRNAADPGRVMFGLLLTWLALDLGVYHVERLIHTPRLDSARQAHLSVMAVEAMPYRAHRQDDPPEGRSALAYDLTLREGPARRGVAYTFGAGFLQFDPYLGPELRRDVVSRHTYRFLTAIDALDPSGAIQPQALESDLSRVLLGVGAPKLRLVRTADHARDRDEAELLLRQRRAEAVAPSDVLIVEAMGPADAAAPRPGAPGLGDRIDVLSFRANGLAARVEVSSTPGAWLVYADAYDPWWKARVNGHERPVVRANLGFKAVYLNAGANDVVLEVRPPWWVVVASHVVAGSGAMAALALVACLLKLLAQTR